MYNDSFIRIYSRVDNTRWQDNDTDEDPFPRLPTHNAALSQLKEWIYE